MKPIYRIENYRLFLSTAYFHSERVGLMNQIASLHTAISTIKVNLSLLNVK